MTDAAVLLLSQMPGVYGKIAAFGGVDEMDISRFEHDSATLPIGSLIAGSRVPG